jgi:putative multiple sugar transport system ATP-binding protein
MEQYALEMRNISKAFPGIKALDNVNLQVKPRHIHALVGENGAGKSTLMNVLSGVYPYGTYEGDIIIDGQVCEFKSIKESEFEVIYCDYSSGISLNSSALYCGKCLSWK